MSGEDALAEVERRIMALASCASPADTCYRDHEGCSVADALNIVREVRAAHATPTETPPVPSGAEAALVERLTALADDEAFVEKIAATVALDTNHVEVVRKRLSRLVAVLSETPKPKVIQQGDLRDRISRLDRHFIYDNEGDSTTFVRDDDLAAALAPSAGPDTYLNATSTPSVQVAGPDTTEGGDRDE